MDPQTSTVDETIPPTGELELDLVRSVIGEWRAANRLAADVQAALPAPALEHLRSLGVQTDDEILARWVGAASTLHPDVVATYGALLDYVAGVIDDLAAGQAPSAPAPPAEARRIAELEARVDELETLVAGAVAVLRVADV